MPAAKTSLYLAPEHAHLAGLLKGCGIRTDSLELRKPGRAALVSSVDGSPPTLPGPLVVIHQGDPLQLKHFRKIIDVISAEATEEETCFRVKKALEIMDLKKSVRSFRNQLSKKDIELSTIHAFEENIRTTFILEELLKMIVDVIGKVLTCRRVSVLLLQGEGKDVLVKGRIGSDGKTVENFQIKTRGRVTREILRRKSSLLLRDISRLDWLKAGDERFASYSSCSFLSVPIMVEEEVSAIINVTDKRDGSSFDDADRRLLEIIASQVSGTIQRFNMSHELLEKEKLTKELQVAQEIQINLLPSQNPELPGIEVAFFYQPANLVGGDYFDFFELSDNVSAVLVGDVSGKGVPASLLMVMVRSIVRYAAQKKFLHSSDVIFSELNDYLLQNSASHMFMSLFMGVIDTKKRSLSYTNAGHNYPLILHRDGSFTELKTGNLILGLFEQTTYSRTSEEFSEDDLLIMYTDGVTDACDRNDRMFSEERMRLFFSENYDPHISLREMIDSFRKYFLTVSDAEIPHDDATLILMRKRP